MRHASKTINISIDFGSYLPERAHESDAGLDLKTPKGFTLKPHRRKRVDTGVHVKFPPNTAGLLVSKSGLNVEHGITSTGLIDAGYTGQITVELYNHTNQPYEFEAGDKISQLVIIPILTPTPYIVPDIQAGERGDAGFGSTGR